MRAIKIIGIVILNALMVFMGLVIYYAWTEPMVKHTNNPYGLEMNLTIPLFIAAAIVFLMWKPFRTVGVGIASIVVPSIVFLVFYMNKEIVISSKYEQFRYGMVHVGKDDRKYMSIAFRPYGLNVPLSLEDCVDIDSIQIRIDRGFLGMDVLTDDAKVIENFNCDHQDLDTTAVLESHIKIGKSMFEKRCFQSAMYHLNQASKIDTSNTELHFRMGLINMFWKDYERALSDYYKAFLIQCSQVDTAQYEIYGNPDLGEIAEQLFQKFDSKEFDGIGELSQKVSDLAMLQRYTERLEYCLDKIEESN